MSDGFRKTPAATELGSLGGKAVEIDSEQAGYWCNLGRAYHYRRCFREALKAADRALFLKPGYLAALNVKANAIRRLGDRETALKILEEAISLNPVNFSHQRFRILHGRREDEQIKSFCRLP